MRILRLLLRLRRCELTKEKCSDRKNERDTMTPERLRQYRALCDDLRSVRESIAEIEGRIYAPSGSRVDGSPRGRGGGSMVERSAVDFSDRLDRLRNLAHSIERELEAIDHAINSLPPIERHIIRLHYVDGLSWEMIAEKKNYSARHVRRMHKAAIGFLEAK